MRLRVFSDLHLEFQRFDPPAVDADVVVLAGDIGVKTHGLTWALQTFDLPVVYVPGNHEFYGGATPHLVHKLKAMAAGTHVHVLDEDAVVVGGVRFLGATMWTDFQLFGREHRDEHGEVARAKMNDYRRIRTSPAFSKLTPRAVHGMHLRARAWLSTQLSTTCAEPTVVVTHHAPGLLSIPPHHRADPLSAAYASDLSSLLDGRAHVWIHGHTHHAVDMNVNGTRVVSNQRGYPDEPAEGFDPAFVVEVFGQAGPSARAQKHADPQPG